MKLPLPTLILLLGQALSTLAGPVILGDNFDTADSPSLDASDQTGRKSGLLANEVQLRSGGIQHTISDNKLNLLKGGASGRVRFHDALNTGVRWNFSSGPAGAKILNDRGFRAAFDWIPGDNTSGDWISWSVGINNTTDPGIRVNEAATDFGILFRNNGGTQHFDNGAATTGNAFDAPAVTSRRVIVDCAFTSFDDGATVTATASVDGVPVLAPTVFQWEGNAGNIQLELASYAAGTRIDNFTLSTLAEDGFAFALGNTSFYSSVTIGGLIGLLAATNGGDAEAAAFNLVAGAGSTDNTKFRIAGNRLESNGFNFTALPQDTELFIRVRSIGSVSAQTADRQFVLKIIADADSDDLPDVWEQSMAGNLTDLKGNSPGPGPGAGTGNFDGDSLTDRQEFEISQTTYPVINPKLADTDGDGLEDGMETTGAGTRPPTDPTKADTDADGLSDLVESKSGLFAGPADAGSNPTVMDTDGDYYPDGYEVDRLTNPNDPLAIPALPAGFSTTVLTGDESSGIHPGVNYTHAVSGGYGVTLNGVTFAALDPAATPPHFTWTASAARNEIDPQNLGGWVPFNAGVTGPGLQNLLGGFTYSGTGADPGSSQQFILSGLTPGQSYVARLFLRTWTHGDSGRSIDLAFVNDSRTSQPFPGIGLPEDRPQFVPGVENIDAAYSLDFAYTAEGEELTVLATVPVGAVTGSGSFHLYALSNEAANPPPLGFRITDVHPVSGPEPGVYLTFNTAPGETYAIDYATALAATGQPGGWSEIAAGLIPGGSSIYTYFDTVIAGSAPRLFYRIRLEN